MLCLVLLGSSCRMCSIDLKSIQIMRILLNTFEYFLSCSCITACCVLRAPIWRVLGGGCGHCVLRAACSDLGGSEAVVAGERERAGRQGEGERGWETGEK